MKKIAILLLFLLVFPTKSFAAQGFTQEDRERLVRLETAIKVFRMDMNKRFEQVDKRFFELRMDMNKRFEQVDKRFEQMMKFLWIISGIFTTLTATVIGFAYWDRRLAEVLRSFGLL